MNRENNVELKISHFLRYGVLVSGSLILVGWILKFKLKGDPFFSFQIYDQIPFINLFVFHWKKGDWEVIMTYLGLISLISLPLIRVILLAFLFLRQKEFALALISIAVILLLLISMSLGLKI